MQWANIISSISTLKYRWIQLELHIHNSDRLWPPQLFYICTIQYMGQMPHITHVNNLTEMFFMLPTIHSSDLHFLSLPLFTFSIDFVWFQGNLHVQSIFIVGINTTNRSFATFYFHSFKAIIWLYILFVHPNIF